MRFGHTLLRIIGGVVTSESSLMRSSSGGREQAIEVRAPAPHDALEV
jgi:hypothetical protein